MENPEKKTALQFGVVSAFQNYLKQFDDNAQRAYQKVCRMFDLKPWDKEELSRKIKSLGYSINPLLATGKSSSMVTDIIEILDKGNHYVEADVLREFVMKQADDIDRLRMVSALLEDEDPEQMYDYLMRHGVVVKEYKPVSTKKTADIYHGIELPDDWQDRIDVDYNPDGYYIINLDDKEIDQLDPSVIIAEEYPEYVDNEVDYNPKDIVIYDEAGAVIDEIDVEAWTKSYIYRMIKESSKKTADEYYPYTIAEEKTGGDILYKWYNQETGDMGPIHSKREDVVKEIEKKLSSKKTAQEPKKPEEEIEEKPEEVIKEELPEAPLEDELTPSIELEPEPISEPSILETMTPMDYNLLTTLNKQRETAINRGDTEEMMNVDKQIADIIDKYTMPITPEEMTPEAFIGRRLQTQLGIQRDMIPLLAKASEAIRKLPNIFNVTLGQIGLLKVETSEWQETPESGNIEFVIRIKPMASRIPYRAGIIKINVFEDKAEILPFIWDIAGRKYNLDSDGLKLFLKVDTFKELDEFEKKYLEEERTVQKGLKDGEIKPNVQGLGRVPIIPSGRGISKPKTTWSSKDLLKKKVAQYDEEIVAQKLNKATGANVTGKAYVDWLEGGPKYEEFDKAVKKFLGEETHTYYDGIARLDAKLLWELGLGPDTAGGIDLTQSAPKESSKKTAQQMGVVKLDPDVKTKVIEWFKVNPEKSECRVGIGKDDAVVISREEAEKWKLSSKRIAQEVGDKIVLTEDIAFSTKEKKHVTIDKGAKGSIYKIYANEFVVLFDTGEEVTFSGQDWNAGIIELASKKTAEDTHGVTEEDKCYIGYFKDHSIPDIFWADRKPKKKNFPEYVFTEGPFDDEQEAQARIRQMGYGEEPKVGTKKTTKDESI
jgi:hypothetical protein